MSLDGKVALVTGAATGIGRAIAIELARQGASVVVNHLEQQGEADGIVKEIESKGGKAISLSADVTNSGEVNCMVEQAVGQFGRIDVLVNNAGIEMQHPFLEKPEEEWDRVIAVDLKGPFLCSQAAARMMARRGAGGTIINISSVHEDIPFPGYAAYCAAKGGLRMLCRDLALELAPYHIRIVNVGPGAIATPINRQTLEDPDKRKALEREIPLGYIGKPEEVAKLVAYLASDDASYITGTTIFIDGGLMRNTGSL
ncbi:MAG: SDR family oxidoreductase [Chloroflexi bacterium]|nr:SDR family oxidoreductase [Chloroflexota bacterium]